MRRQGIDFPLLIIALLLTAYGIAMVFSAGQVDVPSGFIVNAWKRQLAWFGVSMVACWVITRGSVRLIEWAAWPLYLLSCSLLLLVLFTGSGAGTAASVSGWITIAGVRIGQPAELAKLATLIMMARVLAERREAPRTLLELWRPVLVVVIPWLLVMAQPDLGTGLVFIGICFGMLFWAGVPWQLLLLLASPAISLVLAFSTEIWGAWFCVLAALVFWSRIPWIEKTMVVVANVVLGAAAPWLWNGLAPYQQRRLLVFLDPSIDPRASGYHVIQSKVAIGSGGLFGKGFTLGTQKRLAFIPERHTDFIFSVLGEELGFIGVSLALTLFLVLLLRSTRIATRAPAPFPSLVAFGIATAWLVHVIVNVGMTLNLMPVTGIPLPFFSYGGSFLVVSWLCIGVLLRVSSEGRGLPDSLGL